MHFLSLVSTVVAVGAGVAQARPAASAPTSAPAPTGSFYLRTAVQSTDKRLFDNLYVYAYHTGAGTNDAMLSANKSHAVAAHAVSGDVPGADGTAYFSVQFDLGSTSSGSTPIPWALNPAASDTIYAGWQPVAIDINGNGPTNQTAFFLGDDGRLQWTNEAGISTESSFNGWFVCQWWHADIDDTTQPGVQLFFRERGYSATTPVSCADVDLVLEYLP